MADVMLVMVKTCAHYASKAMEETHAPPRKTNDMKQAQTTSSSRKILSRQEKVTQYK